MGSQGWRRREGLKPEKENCLKEKGWGALLQMRERVGPELASTDEEVQKLVSDRGPEHIEV